MAHRNLKEFGKDKIQVFSSGIETNLLQYWSRIHYG